MVLAIRSFMRYARPSAINTGPAGTLAANGAWTGSYIHTAPITIDGYALDTHLQLNPGSDGSIITNCTMDTQITMDSVDDVVINNNDFPNAGVGFFIVRMINGCENFLIEDNRFTGPTMTDSQSAIFSSDDSGIIQRNEFLEPWGDAMKLGRSTNGILVARNWIHRIGNGHEEGAHGDGIQAEGGSLNLEIAYNFFDMPTLAGYNHNAGILCATAGADAEWVYIHHNWFDVANQEVRMNDNGVGSIHDCHVWRNRHFGNASAPFLDDGTPVGTRTWGNVLDSTGALMAYNTETGPP